MQGEKRIFPSISAIPIRSQRVMHVIFSPLDISPAGKRIAEKVKMATKVFTVALKWQGRNCHERRT